MAESEFNQQNSAEKKSAVSRSRISSQSSRRARSTYGNLDAQSTMQKMAEFSGEASIFESQSLTLPGETLEISSHRFDAVGFDQSLSVDTYEVSEIEQRETKQKRIKELKRSHAEMKKLSAEGQESDMLNRYEKLSSIKEQEALNDPLIGVCLENKYEIIGIVGRGANATVYKGIRLSDDKIVAIKTIRNKGMEDVWRFNQEIEIMQKMNHPNLMEFIDCIKLDRGMIFLVMELVKGISLQEVLKIHGPIVDEETIWTILSRVSDALRHAHSKSTVHRDLKSGNVVMSKETNQPLSVKVLDFGLAKHDKSTNITMHGITLGSPLYMSPEQCKGEEPTAQSDIYSLGIMSYEIVAGVVPFIGETITDIMAAHCDPAVTHIPIQEVCPDLKCGQLFDRILYKALGSVAAVRYPNVEKFQEDLDKWINAVRAL